MDFISSSKATRVNALALLTILPKYPYQIILNHFERIMKAILPEVMKDVDKKQGNPGHGFAKTAARQNRMQDWSTRKGQNREQQLYDEVDLLNYFKQNVQAVLAVFSQNGASVPNFENEYIGNNIQSLLNTS